MEITKEVLFIIKMVVVIAILGLESVKDIRTRKISLKPILIGMLFGVFLMIPEGINGFWAALAGMLPGIPLIVFSFLTKEKIGYGDGFILIFAGFLLGIRCAVFILLSGMLCCALVSVILLILKKGDRNTTLPFVPFLILPCILYCFVK